MHAPAAVTATGALLLCAACGGVAAKTPSRTWHANAHQLVAQLRGDVDAVQAVGASRRAFVAGGEMYILLVAYSDLSACSSMASATAAPARVIRMLAAPCPQLEHASALFTQAEGADDARLLARAERVAALARPALIRAAAGIG